jgi:hypothetical protein
MDDQNVKNTKKADAPIEKNWEQSVFKSGQAISNSWIITGGALLVCIMQGDQMSLWKNRPDCSPAHFLSKYVKYTTLFMGKSILKNLGYFCDFQRKQPKENHRPIG